MMNHDRKTSKEEGVRRDKAWGVVRQRERATRDGTPKGVGNDGDRRIGDRTRWKRRSDEPRGEETTDGARTDGNAERERKGDWSHLYGPEYCAACGQKPFECGCVNVSFESKWEKKRQERRERERERRGNRRRVGSLCSRVASQAGWRVDGNGCKMLDGAGREAGEKTMDWEWEEQSELDPEDRLRVLREEMAEMSLRVERLERAMIWEGSGSSSSSGGSDWAWWNGAWWVRTGATMNSESKRRVSKRGPSVDESSLRSSKGEGIK